MSQTGFVASVASTFSTFLLFVEYSVYESNSRVEERFGKYDESANRCFAFVVAKRRILSRNRIKIETSKEEPLALKIEAEAFFSLSFDNDSFAIYTVHYIPYIIPTMESNRCNFLHRQSSDKGFSRRKRDALPHFALVNRIHPRAFGTIEFRSEFR